MANPTGEIEVSLGEFPPLDLSLFPPELFNFSDPFSVGLSQVDSTIPQEFYIPQAMSTGSMDGIAQTSSRNSSPSNVSYNPDDYLDFGTSSSFGDASDFQAASSAVGAVAGGTPAPAAGTYVPPAGAANSSLRRVGGSWNKQFAKAQTPSPPRTTGMTQFQ